MSAQLKDLTRLHQPALARSGMVKVSYGVHNLEAAIAGKSVSEVRQALKEPLNIDPRALALVNGRDVAASHILKQGDQLEFVRLAGEKGGNPLMRRFSPGFLTCLPKKGNINKLKYLVPINLVVLRN
jgi:hypothetical protein